MAVNRQTYTDDGKKTNSGKPKTETQSVTVGGRSVNVPTSNKPTVDKTAISNINKSGTVSGKASGVKNISAPIPKTNTDTSNLAGNNRQQALGTPKTQRGNPTTATSSYSNALGSPTKNKETGKTFITNSVNNNFTQTGKTSADIGKENQQKQIQMHQDRLNRLAERTSQEAQNLQKQEEDARNQRINQDPSYEYNFYEFQKDGKVMDGQEYVAKIDENNKAFDLLGQSFQQLEEQYKRDGDYRKYASGYDELINKYQQLLDERNDLSGYKGGYNETVTGQYNANKSRMEELIRMSANLKKNGGSKLEIETLNNEYMSLKAENEQLKTLRDDIENLKESDYYNWLKENADEKEIRDFESYLASKDDSEVQRRIRALGSSVLNVPYAVLSVADISRDLLGESAGAILDSVAESFHEKGYMDDESFEKVMAVSNGLKAFEYDNENNISQMLRDYRERVNREIEAGDRSPTVSIAGKMIDSALENYIRWQALGEAGTYVMALSQFGDSFKENMDKGYSAPVSVLNAGLKAYITWWSENLSSERYFKILGSAAGSKIDKLFFSYLASNLVGMVPEEGIEEGIEYTFDYGADLISSILQPGVDTPVFSAGDLFKGSLIAMGSTVLSATGGAITGTMNYENDIPVILNGKDYEQFSTEVANLKEIAALEPDLETRYALQNYINKCEARMEEYEEKSPTAKAVKLSTDEASIPSQDQADQTYKDSMIPNAIADSNEQAKTDDELTEATDYIKAITNSYLAQYGINMNVDKFMEMTPQEREETISLGKGMQESGLGLLVTRMMPGRNGANYGNLTVINSDQTRTISIKSILGMSNEDFQSSLNNSNIFKDAGADPSSKAAASHELSHFAEKSGLWSRLKSLVINELGEDGYKLAKERIGAIYEKYGEKNADTDHEVVAFFLQENIDNKDFLTKLAKYDSSIFERLHRNIRSMFTNDSKTRLETTFMEAIRSAKKQSIREMKQLLRERKSGYVGENWFTPAMAQMSIAQYDLTGRDILKSYLKESNLSKKSQKELLDRMEEAYTAMQEFEKTGKFPTFSKWQDTVYDIDKDGNFSVVISNGDYDLNIDFSTVCKKRKMMDKVLNELSRNGFLNEALSRVQLTQLRNIIEKHGMEVACGLCFVDAKRFNQGSWAGKFETKWNGLIDQLVALSGIDENEVNTFGSKASGFETTPGLANIDFNDPKYAEFVEISKDPTKFKLTVEDGRMAKAIIQDPSLRSYISTSTMYASEGLEQLKANVPKLYDLVNASGGSSKPKLAHTEVLYTNEIINSKDFNPEDARRVGGVRVQSFSDFMTNMVFDYVQMFGDMEAKKLTGHSYTKVKEYALLFGKSGMKINLSIIPAGFDRNVYTAEEIKEIRKNDKKLWDSLRENAGLDADGNYIFDKESFDWDLALEIQNLDGYDKNVGTICVGVSDKHIFKMLDDSNVCMVIPYHRSGINPTVADMMGIGVFNDYTNKQNTRMKNAKGRWVKIGKQFDFDFYSGSTTMDGTHFKGMIENKYDAKKTADSYLAWCEKNGYKPKFDAFAEHENYYKLLIDYRAYDKNGNVAPQNPIKISGDGMNMNPTLIDTAANPKLAEIYGDDIGFNNVLQKGLEVYEENEKTQDNALPDITKEVVDKLGLERKQFSLGEGEEDAEIDAEIKKWNEDSSSPYPYHESSRRNRYDKNIVEYLLNRGEGVTFQGKDPNTFVTATPNNLYGIRDDGSVSSKYRISVFKRNVDGSINEDWSGAVVDGLNTIDDVIKRVMITFNWDLNDDYGNTKIYSSRNDVDNGVQYSLGADYGMNNLRQYIDDHPDSKYAKLYNNLATRKQEAEKMRSEMKDGKRVYTDDEIYKKTGWMFDSTDSVFKGEFYDDGTVNKIYDWVNNQKGKSRNFDDDSTNTRLKDVVGDDSLFLIMYPKLADAYIFASATASKTEGSMLPSMPDEKGYMKGTAKRIRIGKYKSVLVPKKNGKYYNPKTGERFGWGKKALTESEIKDTIAHEIQHAIQLYEQFYYGDKEAYPDRPGEKESTRVGSMQADPSLRLVDEDGNIITDDGREDPNILSGTDEGNVQNDEPTGSVDSFGETEELGESDQGDGDVNVTETGGEEDTTEPIEPNDELTIPNDELNITNGNLNDLPSSKTAKVLEERPRGERFIDLLKQGGLQARRFLIDKYAAVDDLAKRYNNKKLTYLADRVMRTGAIASRAIYDGIVNKDGKVIGKSLTEIMGKISPQDKQLFGEYMYHWRNVDEMSMVKRFGKDYTDKPVFGNDVTADDSMDRIREIEKTHTEFKEVAEDMWELYRNLLGIRRDAGIISQKTYDKFIKERPHYVRIIRNVDGGTGGTALNPNDIKRFKGSTEDIIPIDEATMAHIQSTYRVANNNELNSEILKTLGAVDESEVDDIESLVEDGYEPLTKGSKTLSAYRNGIKYSMDVSDELAKALTPTEKNILMKIGDRTIAPISQFRKALITSINPIFTLFTNPTKDLQDAIRNTKYLKNYPRALVKAVNELIHGGELSKLYDNVGVRASGYMGQDIEKALRKINNGNIFAKAWNKARNLAENIEKAPRLAEFIASLEAGNSIDQAAYDAAEVTTNFKRGGTAVKTADKYGFTFLSASVAGFDKQIRNAKDDVEKIRKNGIKGMISVLAQLTLASGLPLRMLLDYLWRDDDDYENLSDYVKNNYYIVGKTNGRFIRIPKGRVAAFYQTVLGNIDKTVKKQVDIWDALLDDLVSFENNLAPNNFLDNNMFSPIVQAYRTPEGRTWYGEDLVPSRLQDVPDYEQYDEGTDSLSIAIGQLSKKVADALGNDKFQISPYKLNYLLDQYTGVIGDVALPALSLETSTSVDGVLKGPATAILDKFTTDPILKNQNVTSFYSLKEEMDKKAKGSQATDEEKLVSKYLGTVSSAMGKLYGEKRKIQLDPNLSNKEKLQRVREIQTQINDLARNALGSYDQIDMVGKYASVGDVQYYQNEDGSWTKPTSNALEKLNNADLSMEDRNAYFQTYGEIDKIRADIRSKTPKGEQAEYRGATIDAINNSKLSAKGKNAMYDSYYSSKFSDYVNDMDLTDEQKYGIKVAKTLANSEKDANGKTIANSKAWATADAYKELGVLEDVLKYIKDNDIKPSDMGLSKTVYESLLSGSSSSSSKGKTSSKSSKKSSKSNVGGSAGGITRAKGGGSTKRLSMAANPIRETKTTNSFVKAYADVLKRNSSKATSSGNGTIVCPKCGNRVSSGLSRCPICGTNL